MVVKKERLKTLSAPALHVRDATIQPTSGARNLGVFFDSHHDLKQHISNVCRSCYFQLRQLRIVRRLLPGVLRTLLHAFVSCRLDYCNSLMTALPLCDITAFAVSQERCCTSLRRRVQTKQPCPSTSRRPTLAADQAAN